jgi:hypothetical protein
MKKLSQTLLALSLGCVFLGANAQTINTSAERYELVQKFGSNQPLNISWYVGAVDPTDFQQTLDRFLGFSNFLSARSNY